MRIKNLFEYSYFFRSLSSCGPRSVINLHDSVPSGSNEIASMETRRKENIKDKGKQKKRKEVNAKEKKEAGEESTRKERKNKIMK